MGIKYVLFGNMASGKTSIAMILKNDLGYVAISARDVILAGLASAPASVQELRKKGYLLPDELIHQWIFERIESEKDKAKPMVLDGYPRTPNQARELLARMPVDFEIIYPDFSIEIIEPRFRNRVLCDECQMPSSLLFTDFNNQCFYCKSARFNPRPTDQPDYFKVKTGQFLETTLKILPEFDAHNIPILPIQNHSSFQALREEVLNLVQKGDKDGN